MSRISTCWVVSLVLFSLSWTGQSVVADDFRVESKVFVGMDEEPASTNLTLFHQRIAYDFSSDEEIIVFDRSNGRLIVLDLRRKTKTEIPVNELLAAARAIRRLSAEQKDALLNFAAAPDFEISQESNTWTFAGKPLTYRVEYADAPDEEKSATYRDFCDWFARLNVMLHPGSLPPFARMAVNAHLERQNAVPTTIRLNIAPHKRFGNREFHVRSEHDFRWGLRDSDLSKVDQAQKYLATFKETPIERYQQNLQANAN